MTRLSAGCVCLWLVASCTAAATSVVQLIPAPARMQSGSGSLEVRGPLPILLAPASDANRFAVSSIRRDLPVEVVGTSRPGGMIAGLLGQAVVDREVSRLKLETNHARMPEGYILHAGRSGVLVAASSEAGLFYGMQTLRQLARPAGGAITIPEVTISDAPALRYRGLSIDISRGPVLTEEQMRELVRTLSEFKFNMLTFYMEHVFPYSHTPLVAPPGTGVTPKMMSRLAAYARQHHIDLVPQQQTFGHLHHLLKHETYAGMGERPHGSVLAAEDERVYEWIGAAGRQLASAFGSEFLNIGSDETFELGQGRSRALVDREGIGGAYLHHMRRAIDVLRPLNKKLMFWGDMALEHPEILPGLPKELIAMTWNYDARVDFDPLITPFVKHGFTFFVCPGLNNWLRIYPNVAVATANINGFVRDGRKLGAAGMLNTHWNDEGEGLLNVNWYPIVFSAAAAWEAGVVNDGEFRARFDWVFYRSSEPIVSRVVERFERAHALFAKAGLTDANDRLFWMDPFSASGSKKATQAAPIASEVRLLAEQNLIDLAAAPKLPVRSETLRYLVLAAHRLNYLGMKIQFSRYMGTYYRQALANQADAAQARRSLRRLSSTTGYVEDLRAAILDIKALYREAWLAENQPYWLDNVMVMYDAEAMYWQNKARQFGGIIEDFRATGHIPAPESLGLRFPE